MLLITKKVQPFKEDKIVALNSVALNSYKEKRQHPRFSVKLPLDYWQTPEVIQGGLVANISETGLLMHSVHKIQIGTKLRIRVYLSKDNSLDCIEGKAKIMWMNFHREQGWIGYRYGVHIMQMPPGYQDRLMKYILTLQEEERSSN
jgi:c-di-GMP-binding flagellar brake protein YcgR